MRKTNLITPFFQTAFALCLCITVITGCRKKVSSPDEQPIQVEAIANTNDPAQPVITIPADHTLQPTKSFMNYTFDWEHAQTMAVVRGAPAVPVPWSDQAVRNYDPGLRYDYKKSDGWELLYNNFSDSLNFLIRYFVLYNKFRGLVRCYFYNVTPSNPTVDSYRWLINELSLSSPYPSPLLNYADQFIIDINSNSNSVSLVEPWPISQNGWYIAQFEMAYDRQIALYDYHQFNVSWKMEFDKVYEQSLNNTSVINKMVYLQKPGLRFSDLSSLGARLTGDMQVHVKAANGLNELSGVFPDAVINKLKQTIYDSTAGNKLNATLVPALGMADCKLDVTASYLSESNLVGYIVGLWLATPGLDNSQVIGSGPLFNEPMGIFYLGAKPVIRHSTTTDALPEQYTLDVASVEYVINPFIQQYATVRNFRQEIVATAATDTTNLTEATLYQGKILKASRPLTPLGVRVYFEVVPANGSAPVTIIKTFKADVRNG